MEILIKVDGQSSLPKYNQIARSVSQLVTEGLMKKGDQLPSINQLCDHLDLSRDTVVKGYNLLKKKGLVSSGHGKGFYISTSLIDSRKKVMLLLAHPSEYNGMVYQQLRTKLTYIADVQLFYHNQSEKDFKRMIDKNLGFFEYYIINSPEGIHPDWKNAYFSEQQLKKTLWLDSAHDRESQSHIAIDWEEETFRAFCKMEDKARKYLKLNFIYPTDYRYAPEIQRGFERFCKEKSIQYAILNEIPEIGFREAFIVLNDNDLVRFVKGTRKTGLVIGQDAGVVSFNDSPLKEIIDRGITVVSIDFQAWTDQMASFISSGKQIDHENRLKLIQRFSF